MTSLQRALHACSLLCTATLTIGLLSSTSTPAQASSSPQEATVADSDARIWGGIDGTRYGDSIRKTARITYTDAGIAPSASCDVVGDNRNDAIFVNSERSELNIVPFIPYGSDSDDVTIPISEQAKVLRFSLPTENSPAPEKSQTWQVSCVKIARGEKQGLLLAHNNTAYVVSIPADSTHTSQLKVHKIHHFDAPVKAISATSPALEEPEFAAVAGTKLYYFSTINTDQPTKTWELGSNERTTLSPIGSVFNDSNTLGIGLPDQNLVYALNPHSAQSGDISQAAVKITGMSSDNKDAFGTSIVGIADVNNDDIDDFAIGAPAANNATGAVAVVFGNKNQPLEKPQEIRAQLDSVNDVTVTHDGKKAGTLIRQTVKGRIGISLAYVQGHDVANPGALVIGRPDNEEHPGAIVVSSTALTKDWNTSLGLDSIPSNQSAWLASDENEGSGGTFVGTIPAFDSDAHLTGVLTADSQGKIDLWTVDMRRQHDKTPPVKPLYPAPVTPLQPAAISPINTPVHKRWVGEFSNGLGSSIARGSCDVTGDKVPDIVTASPVRSEWKFDVHYESSTPTHGWLLNVTGQVQIIPGGTPGSALPDSSVITILGPKATEDPAVDAAVGLSVACIGDANGDGVDDIAVNSHTMGRVWVLFGGSTLPYVDLNHLDPRHGYYVQMPFDKGAAGYQVSKVGDVNHDGLADVGFVISNTPYSRGEKGAYGTALIVAGKRDGDIIDLRDSYKSRSVLFEARTPHAHTLSAFTPVGDVNGDALTDYALADFNSVSDRATVPGTAWVVFGSHETTFFDLQKGVPGYTLSISDDASYRLGAGNSIASVGDVDHDGFGDFVIGYDGGQIANATTGGVALVYGSGASTTTLDRRIVPTFGASRENYSDSNVPRRMRTAFSSSGRVNSGGDHTERAHARGIESGHLDEARISVLTGTEPGSGFGWAVDALPEKSLLAIGAWGESGNGAVFVLHTSDIPAGITRISELGTKVKRIDTDAQRARFGRSVAFIGGFLGEETLAIGADGVIDDPAAGQEGYSHAAHLVALDVTTLFGDGQLNPQPDDPHSPISQQPNKNIPGSDTNTQEDAQKVHLATSGSETFSLVCLLVVLIGAGVLILSKRRLLLRHSK